MTYTITATLGPASEQEETWLEMLLAGVTAFRLNTSHLSLDSLWAWLDRLGPFLGRVGSPVSLVLDLQGSKWRLGQFPPFSLREGELVTLMHAAESTRAGFLPVPHADFFRAAPQSSAEIILNDAKSRLAVVSIEPDGIQARVTLGGEIAPRKGITFAASTFRTEALNDQDQAIFAQTRDLNFIQYAVSYVRDAEEMGRYRALFGPSVHLIAKLERGLAMAEADRISGIASCSWICRGDLGAELGMKAMAQAVSRFSSLVKTMSVPAVMAGQVLEHMTGSATPTRSEVCYLYDALQAGYQGFVLSDETAIGRYPVESCRAAAMFKA